MRYPASMAIALLLGAAPLAAQGAAEFPTGRFVLIMADTTDLIHRATMDFTKDGHYFLLDDGQVLFMGDYSIEGQFITLLGSGDTPCVDASGDAIPGRYSWAVTDGRLSFTYLEDRCDDRRLTAMIALMYPAGSEP